MFIPLHDANNLKRIRLQYVTIALIAINAAAFLLTGFNSDDAVTAAVCGLGYVPAIIHDGQPTPAFLYVPESLTHLTYAFLHGNLLHLGGNMLFLWVFGDNVEDALGHVRYLLFYLACAAAGAFAHGLFAPDSDVPLIGASGAVAGIVAAYLILHPKVRVWVLAFGRVPLRVPAWIPLILWIGLQVVMLVAAQGEAISYAAHVGGLIAGALLVFVLRLPGVPLLDREIIPPRSAEIRAPAPEIETPRWGRDGRPY